MVNVWEAPNDCAKCPRLCASRHAVVNGSGPLTATVLVVAQNPGRQEEWVKPPRPLIGWTGERVRNKLMPLAGIDPATVRYENVVRCRPPRKGKSDDVPKQVEIDNCRQYLKAVIAAMPNLRTIITLGAPALAWFFPHLKVAAVHGQSLEWPSDDAVPPITVVPMIHPAAAAPGRNAKFVQTMVADWERLAQPAAPAARLGEYRLVSGKEMAMILDGWLTAHPDPADQRFAFDTETDAASNKWNGTFQAIRAKCIGFSIAVKEGEAFYSTDSPECIKWYLEEPCITKVMHNAKYEVQVCQTLGIVVR